MSKALELARKLGGLWLETVFKTQKCIPELDEAAAELRRLAAVNAELLEALEGLLNRDELNTCQHEETYRGGAIWEICHWCGSKWADDEGGKPEWKDPAEWDKARAAIASARKQENTHG